MADYDYAADLLRSKKPTSAPSAQPQQQGAEVDYAAELLRPSRGQYSDSVMGRKIAPLEDRANTPEVGSMPIPGVGAALKYSTARAFKGDDGAAIANVLMKALPEAELLYDQDPQTGQEVPYLSYKGKAYYINKPGLSMADAEGAVGNIVGMAPAGRFAMGGKTLTRQAGRAAAGAGATSVAGDVAVSMMGGQNDVDIPKAGINAALAPIAQVVGAKLFPILNNKPLVDVFGNLTPDGAAAMRQANIDPASFTKDALARLNDAYRKMGPDFNSDAGRAVAAKIQTEQFGIPQTLGQQTQDVRQIAREQAMRNYARGQSAGDRMSAFDATQRGAVAGAAERETGRLASRDQPSFANEYEAGATIGENVRQAGRDLKGRIENAYAVAESKPLEFKGVSLNDLKSQVEAAINAENVTLKQDLTPATLAAIERVQGIKNSVKLSGQTPGLPKWSKTVFEDVDFRDLETTRKQLNGLLKAAKNPADERGVKTAIQAFDSWIDEAVEKGLAQGDSGAITALKEARALRTRYGDLFEKRTWDADAGRVMERLMKTDVTPNEVANLIIGYGDAGQSPVATRVATRLRDIFGAESAEWNQIRELAFMRIVNGPKGTPSGPQAIVSRFDRALQGKAESFIRELYTPEEITRMRQFRDSLNRLVPPKGATNPSGSGYEVARMFEDFASKLLGAKALTTADPTAAAGAAGLKVGKSIANSRAAGAAAAGVPNPPGRGYAAAPGVAATAGDEARRRYREPPPNQK